SVSGSWQTSLRHAWPRVGRLDRSPRRTGTRGHARARAQGPLASAKANTGREDPARGDNVPRVRVAVVRCPRGGRPRSEDARGSQVVAVEPSSVLLRPSHAVRDHCARNRPLQGHESEGATGDRGTARNCKGEGRTFQGARTLKRI